ncbi:MAG: acyltransferase [Acidobacteriota bacterium]|jgi:galactoside O-acetyltransferase
MGQGADPRRADANNQAASLPFKRRGEDVIVWPLAKIIAPQVIELGNSVIIDDFVFFAGGQGAVIGDFVHIACHTSVTGGGAFVMEDFAGLSGGVRIYTGNEDYTGGSLTNPTVPAPFRQPIRSWVILRRHAIVGANAVILPGVEIGEGAVVGANALVRSSCEPWTIYVGSPAQPVKSRPRDTILRLEAQLRAAAYDDQGRYIPVAQRQRS